MSQSLRRGVPLPIAAGGEASIIGGPRKRFLKAELKRAEASYRELGDRLKEHGLEETEASIANKLSRGSFAATFFLASLVATGVEAVRLEDV